MVHIIFRIIFVIIVKCIKLLFVSAANVSTSALF